MLGNWIECTHNGTGGTGTLTLAAVSGSPQFTGAFGASGTRLVSYTINEFTDSTRTQLSKSECGIGSLELSTNVLTRTKRLATWNGTTYDDTSPAAVSFGNTAANIRILCSPLADMGSFAFPFVNSGHNSLGKLYGMNFGGQGSTSVLTNNQETYYPMLWPGMGEITEVSVECTTLDSAPGLIKGAVYDVGSDGYPGAMRKDLGVADLSATGTRVFANANFHLPAGWYYVANIANTNTAVLRINFSAIATPMGVLSGAIVLSDYRTGTYSTGLADPAPTTGYNGPIVNSSHPMLYFKVTN
jgi:hypothetical protein